ncbi:MAG TPA: tetratricopeptide repeat protein [Pyrinomonadaceae bacterium]|nr:tetratricopeptide repeat protein [Pyrinomonadaceae bacterium]
MLKINRHLRITLCVVLFFTASISLTAQTDEELGKIAAQAISLFQAQEFVAALPHFEKLAKAMPDEGQIRFLYGFCLIAKSKQVTDTTEAKQLSEKALSEFKEAKMLGAKDPAVDTFIAMLGGGPAPTNSGGEPMYSKNPEAEKTMNQAESLFAQSKYDEAIKLFEKALALDPTIYDAATSGGDCFVAKSDWENAEKWYQKGIAIDPNREKAYRYSATPFMRQKKYDLARDRYIEAYIVEPYNSMSSRGINQWANVTSRSLKHPEVAVPEIAIDAKGKATPKIKIDAADTSMSPWLAYIAVRESWAGGKFAKAFPKESKYRHSVAEESEALRAAVKESQDQKSANKHFQTLAQLDKDGLLEAFVILALADDGIADDHPEYLKTNRPKLRQYVANYVIQK